MSTEKTRKNFNLLDLLVLTTVALSITGYVFAKGEKTSLNKIIENKENIAIEVLIPDVFSGDEVKEAKNDFFKVSEKSAITIRNRPYTQLTIIKLESHPKLTTIPNLGGSYRTIADPTKTNLKDYIVTLTDTALKTKDGYVVGGNKIKIGNQVELEGFNYRLGGKVINVYPTKPLNE